MTKLITASTSGLTTSFRAGEPNTISSHTNSLEDYNKQYASIGCILKSIQNAEKKYQPDGEGCDRFVIAPSEMYGVSKVISCLRKDETHTDYRQDAGDFIDQQDAKCQREKKFCASKFSLGQGGRFDLYPCNQEEHDMKSGFRCNRSGHSHAFVCVMKQEGDIVHKKNDSSTPKNESKITGEMRTTEKVTETNTTGSNNGELEEPVLPDNPLSPSPKPQILGKISIATVVITVCVAIGFLGKIVVDKLRSRGEGQTDINSQTDPEPERQSLSAGADSPVESVVVR